MALKINWQIFRVKNEDNTKAFEELCYHLFCRKYKQLEGIRVDYNQVGLETYPITNGKEVIGFQSKFFDNKLSDKSSIDQINHSIAKAKKAYPGLTRIVLYTHQSFGSGSPKYKKDIETKANPVKIQWITESNFQSLLFQPGNLDLAQLYFGLGHELGFIKNNISPEINTLLLSASFINLPLSADGFKGGIDLTTEILKPGSNIFVISGSPGSGKSILMHRLFQKFGGLDQKTDTKMLSVIVKQGAVPMLINLKLCNSDTLENIIRGRQTDNNLRRKALSFIYLFDGLDELNEFKANQALSYIAELCNHAQTAKIIISCRSGNLNALRARNYLKTITDYKIDQLDYSYTLKYFKAKGNINKTQKLALLQKENSSLLGEIKDVLLITILWEIIEELGPDSTTIHLLEKKVTHLIQDPKHHKNIEELNLLNPKEKEILELNQELSYFFQTRFQFRFPQNELQEFIIKRYPRLDYRSVNILTDYLAALFFERNNSQPSETNFIYQHRRYQEFFFAQKLKKEFEINPSIIRKLKVLSSHDFFETLFLPFLRSEYQKENNLTGFLGLNLIDVYLGKHKGWGADNAYYKDSKQFVTALSVQSPGVFEQIINDESLQIAEELFIKPAFLKQAIKDYRQSSARFPDEQYLKNIWEEHMTNLLKLNAELHKHGKTRFQQSIFSQIEELRAIYAKEGFASKYQKIYNDTLLDPYWKEWYSYLYHLVVISNKSIADVYDDEIKRNYPLMKGMDYESREEQGKKKLINDFIRIGVEYKINELGTILDQFDKFQFLSLLEVLSTPEFLPYFYSNADIRKFIDTSIDSNRFQVTEFHFAYVFFKKILGKAVLEEEFNAAKSRFQELEKLRGIDLKMRGVAFQCAVLSFIFDRYTFSLFLNEQRKSSLYIYNELGIFCTLFKEFVLLLSKERNVASICGDFVKYCTLYNENKFESYFTSEITQLLACIINHGWSDINFLKKLIKITVRSEYNINPFEFFLNLKHTDNKLYLSLITEPVLESFEKDLNKSDGFFQDYIDYCFELSILFSEVNDTKSVEYFIKGINDGILRHGWRKDYIVSYLLVDAFEIVLRNRWLDEKKLNKCAFEILSLAIRVSKITDGKGTQHGPYTFIKTVALYDMSLTEKLVKKLKSDLGNIGNSTKAAIIRAKIEDGLPFENLEGELDAISIGYRNNGKPNEDYYFEKFKTYLAAALNYFYSDAERAKAFESAYSQIEEVLSQNYEYLNFSDSISEDLENYKSLCTHYNKPFNIPRRKDDNSYKSAYDPIREKAFMYKISSAKTKRAINLLYDKLYKSDSVLLHNQESWSTLVNKTYEILGNISPFLKVMEKNLYPHSDYFTHNASFLHFGLAAALGNSNTQKEALDYLSLHSGHGGFVNTMKAYEVLRDKEQCLTLFNRFLQFCLLLVK
ncbi:NACHT domain-containing protein [Lacibacter cauensis]|uniref:NACHT domain-containing protein n=1 Tax=Lacibacter cauensis TaxID=510947 RepID=A0A562SZ20_9BACT|nr:NACHT domain-containing protein [Lacibacter cauensis]TWI85870.1 NACHT domain-containing protein [Lacibacter cauensis]